MVSVRLIFTIILLFMLTSCGGGDLNDNVDEVNVVEVTNNADIKISIAKWRGKRGSAISFDWDDNNRDHCQIIAPLFNKYNFKATFGVISSHLKNIGSGYVCYKAIAYDGHEIASHSKTHGVRFSDPNASQEDKLDELLAPSLHITESLNIKPTLFIHPGNGYDEDNILYDRFYLFSRINNPFDEPENFIANIGEATDLDRFMYILSLNKLDSNWVKIAGHGVDGYGYMPVKSSDLDQFLSHLVTQDVWVDTHSAIGLYQMARTKTLITAKDGIIEFSHSGIDWDLLRSFRIQTLILTVVIESAEAIEIDGYLSCSDFSSATENLTFDYDIMLQKPLTYKNCAS